MLESQADIARMERVAKAIWIAAGCRVSAWADLPIDVQAHYYVLASAAVKAHAEPQAPALRIVK